MSNTLWPEICSVGHIDYGQANLTSDGVNKYVYEVHDRGLICQKYVQYGLLYG